MCTYFPNTFPGEKYGLLLMTTNKGINELILRKLETKTTLKLTLMKGYHLSL